MRQGPQQSTTLLQQPTTVIKSLATVLQQSTTVHNSPRQSATAPTPLATVRSSLQQSPSNSETVPKHSARACNSPPQSAAVANSAKKLETSQPQRFLFVYRVFFYPLSGLFPASLETSSVTQPPPLWPGYGLPPESGYSHSRSQLG
jgi:hypothetical protein